MQKPSYKWIPFLLIALVISIIVEYLLNWSMSDVFVSAEATYAVASIVFTILLMVASLLIWYCNRLYFRKSYRTSFWNVLYNICLLYTSDAADERSSVDLGGRRIIK